MRQALESVTSCSGLDTASCRAHTCVRSRWSIAHQWQGISLNAYALTTCLLSLSYGGLAAGRTAEDARSAGQGVSGVNRFQEYPTRHLLQQVQASHSLRFLDS